MQLIILGMHRSGTSALGGLIDKAGVYFGPPGCAFPHHETNSKGFFERTDVVRINDRLLESAGASWTTPQRFPDARELDGGQIDLFEDARSVIRELDSHPRWYLKDPRMCITLPFWQPLFRSPVYILMLRNPLDVAQSLARRGDGPIPVGLALWECYTLGMLRHTQGQRRAIIWFEDVMRDPVRALTGLFTSLGSMAGDVPELPDDETILSWFERKMVHHESTDDELASYAGTRFMELYRSVRHDASCADVASPISGQSSAILDAFDAEIRARRLERERSKAWKCRMRRAMDTAAKQGHAYHQQVEGLLQSWRWRGPNLLLSKAGRSPNRKEHGFSESSLRGDAANGQAFLYRELDVASAPDLMQPEPLYPQHNPDTRMMMDARRILLLAGVSPGRGPEQELIETTMLLTAYGHEVNWLSETERDGLIEPFRWPVFCYVVPGIFSGSPDAATVERLTRVIDDHDVLVWFPGSGSSHNGRPLASLIPAWSGTPSRTVVSYPFRPRAEPAHRNTSTVTTMAEQRRFVAAQEAFLRAIAAAPSLTARP